MRQQLFGTSIFILSSAAVVYLIGLESIPVEFKWAVILIYFLYLVVIVNVEQGM